MTTTDRILEAYFRLIAAQTIYGGRRMTTKDSLGDRMKEYESVTRARLMRRCPAILRADGKAFHSLTRGMAKPSDPHLVAAMNAAAHRLCEEIQGATMAYVQSDEISVLILDYAQINTEAWFDSQIQKMVSVAASFATVAFNRSIATAYPDKATAVFDARVFNLPLHEVVNYFIWRQQDAVRNSIQSLAQANFSPREIHGVSCDALQEMLFRQLGINWNDIPTSQKRGTAVRRVETEVEGVPRSKWETDEQIPTFTADRGYIERLVYSGEMAR